jgi:hypothetical protein
MAPTTRRIAELTRARVDLPETIWRVFLLTALLTGVFASGLLLLRWARRGGKGKQAVGAMLMLFSWGNMRDPRNDTVAEAKDGRVRRGTHAGDPLDDDPR